MNRITVKLDLYEYKQVEANSRLIAERLGLPQPEVEDDLAELTTLLENHRDEREKGHPGHDPGKRVTVPPEVAAKCLEFLKQPGLIGRINGL
ncbi:hypothetical protein LJC37_04615, partial [Bacteroidales bacterium OttesenSCG-928-E04]|nr:hypothetical protein [Bacteroidales bacterium OttesenSCG-928-E04]